MNKQKDLLLNKLRKRIDHADIISFDVFDTLLLRPYARPIDMFLHLEKIEHRQGFAQARYIAERRAQVKLARELTLDDIYDEMGNEYEYLKDKEIEFEKRVLCQNPELLQVYDYARSKGKKIIIASDMYLPSELIAEALRKCGYEGWDMLLVSGELGMTKRTGEMYRHILSELDIQKASQLLHIGDNKRSDVTVPRNMGIKAYHYQSVWSRFIEDDERLSEFYRGREGELGASVLLGLRAIHRQQTRCNGEENYWENLGYEYTGPVACAYADFAAREYTRHKLTKMLWVARDAYTLQKVCDILHPEIKSAYIYAPRFLNIACRFDIEIQSPHICERLATLYASKCPDLQKALNTEQPATEDEYKQFIINHRDLAEDMACREMENYRAYLATMVDETDQVGLGDTITINYSAQKLVQAALKRPVLGIYWGDTLQNMSAGSKRQPYTEFVSNMRNTAAGKDIFTDRWDFMEFLLTAPEAPVHSISANYEPEHFFNLRPEEQLRIRLYTQVAKGALDFAQEVVRLFGRGCALWDNKLIIDWVNCFLRNPSREDIKQFTPVCMALDSAHTVYEPLLVARCSLFQFLLHPWQMRKKIKRSTWHSSWHNLLLCILKPFSLKRKSNHHWTLMLFPHLVKRYFVAVFRLGRAGSIRFTIGR